MKLNRIHPVALAVSIAAAAVVIGADTTPKKDAAKPAAAAPAATAPAAPEDKYVKLPEGVLATVDGEQIKATEVEAALTQAVARQGMPADGIPAEQRKMFTQMILKDLITERILTKASSASKITDAEVDGEFKTIREKNGNPSDEELKKQLAAAGLTIEGLKTDIRKQMQQRKWVEDQIKDKVAAPADADAQDFYDKNPQHFEKPEMVRASHILFRLEQTATPEQVTAALKKAEAATKRTKTEDFAKLADELSEDPSAKQNHGDLDFFPQKGAMVEPFADAAFKLKKGETTAEPVRSPFGYHIIKVTDRTEGGKQPFAEVKPKIVTFLTSQKKRAAFEGVLTDLRAKAKVELSETTAPAPASAATPAIAAPAAPAKDRKPVEAVTPPVTVPAEAPKK